MTTQVDIRRADRAHVWHPYTQHGTAPEPVPIVRATGAYLYDEDGREILDAISSWWVTLHGHAHPVIADAIAAQARRMEHVMFAGFTHRPAAQLAAELVRIAPAGLTRVFFSDDGSTAVEVAIKMAMQYWANADTPRTLVVALEHAYHGDTFGAMSVSARSVFTSAFTPWMFDVLRIDTDAIAAGALATLVAERGGEIAAVIVEPMLQGAGGMRLWPADSVARVRTITQDAGIPLIADEVLTGFGRTGPTFACEHAAVAPDIMCLSKGLTGGFLPMGATLATEQIFARFTSTDRMRTLFHGHSYTANPLACAAALASVELMDDACAERRANIERTHHIAAARFATHQRVRNTRVLGTLLAFEIDSGAGYLNPVGPALGQFALERGVLLRPLGNTVYVLPPYCALPADLDRAYGVISDFLETR